jgi:hypothetical protein
MEAIGKSRSPFPPNYSNRKDSSEQWEPPPVEMKMAASRAFP